MNVLKIRNVHSENNPLKIYSGEAFPASIFLRAIVD